MRGDFTTKGTGQGKVPQGGESNKVDDAAKRISKLASNQGTSKAKPKATIKSIRKDTKDKKRDARRTTRDENRTRRRNTRDTNRSEKDPAKRAANTAKTQKANAAARVAMRTKKKSIRKKAKG